MEQKEAVMVLFDREEEYARLLSEFLRRQKELPWEIHTYTKMEELLEREKNGKVKAGHFVFTSFRISISTRKLTRCGRNCWNCMWRRWEHNCRFCVQSIRQNL